MSLKRTNLLGAILVYCVFLGFSSSASAEQPAQHRLYWESFTGAGYNALGLLEQFTLGYRFRLYESKSELLENNFIDLAIIPASSPAYGLVGARLWIQPLSILNLRVRYDAIRYYGNFGHLQSFADPFADHSDDELTRLKDEGTNYSTTASRIWLTAQLQGKVGPIAIRNTFRALKMWVDLRDDDRVFYSPLLDYMMEDGGLAIFNNFDIVYVLDEIPLVLGLRHHVMWSHYSPGLAAQDPNGPAQRAGPLVVWPFLSNPEGAVTSGRAIFLVNWYIDHKYRAGQESSQLLPYIAGALVFEGDLL